MDGLNYVEMQCLFNHLLEFVEVSQQMMDLAGPDFGSQIQAGFFLNKIDASLHMDVPTETSYQRC